MSSKDEFVKLFKDQIKVEKTIVDSVKEGLVEIENPAVTEERIEDDRSDPLISSGCHEVVSDSCASNTLVRLQGHAYAY